MKTKIFDIKNLEDPALKEAADILKLGGTVAFPTESVYGLGAIVFSETAIDKIYQAKGRPSDNPLIAHIYDVTQLEDLVENIPEVGHRLIQAFWPGPITLIFESKGTVAKNMTGGLKTLAVRMPSHSIARKLLELTDIPVAAPSANLSGKPSPTLGHHVIKDLSGRVDGIVVESHAEHGLESTILDLTEDPPMLLRPGGITLESIEAVVGKIQVDPNLEEKMSDDFQPKAPGMKYTHYSPKADVVVINGPTRGVVEKIQGMIEIYAGKRVGVMCTDETLELYSDVIKLSLGSRLNMAEIGANLFKILREFDEYDVDIILAEGYDTRGVGKAIMNRLNKAAGYNIINVNGG